MAARVTFRSATWRAPDRGAERDARSDALRREADRAAERAYWHETGARLRAAQATSFARLYSDEVHRHLVERWWPSSPVRAALKTDLFEEACGAGLAAILTERARHVVAIDIAAGTAVAARARHGDLRVVEADVRALPFRSASFDVAVSSSTLDHFASRAEIAGSLRELARVLRPGGTLILTLDNPANPLLALRRAVPRLWRALGIVPYRVGATLGPRALRHALAAASFRTDELAAVMHVPRFPAAVVARLPRSEPGAGGALARGLLRFERLGDWPTRFLTGHFLAALAVRV
ncbi:MAG TPA: class I SAM-dependent methyltransferase [Candidatus Binatia bacterium]|nr:class I SAM-dependent methyltransferase [Candidatus Binatia bacterium]